jgi:hypothetical protein
MRHLHFRLPPKSRVNLILRTERGALLDETRKSRRSGVKHTRDNTAFFPSRPTGMKKEKHNIDRYRVDNNLLLLLLLLLLLFSSEHPPFLTASSSSVQPTCVPPEPTNSSHSHSHSSFPAACAADVINRLTPPNELSDRRVPFLHFLFLPHYR